MYSFYYFLVIKGKPRDGVKIPSLAAGLALKCPEILHRLEETDIFKYLCRFSSQGFQTHQPTGGVGFWYFNKKLNF